MRSYIQSFLYCFFIRAWSWVMPGSSRSAYKSRLSLSIVRPSQGRVPGGAGNRSVEEIEEAR